jgi:hypothetical protein
MEKSLSEKELVEVTKALKEKGYYEKEYHTLESGDYIQFTKLRAWTLKSDFVIYNN